MPWEGYVWCNPPYGKYTIVWLERMAFHNNGIALIFARTETDMFFKYVWPCMTSILFIKGRITFYRIDGTKAAANSGAPSVLVAYGKHASLKLEEALIDGAYIRLK